MEIEQILNQISFLSDSSLLKIIDKTQLIKLAKSAIVIDTDKVEKKIYFVKKGILRAYTIDDEKKLLFGLGLSL